MHQRIGESESEIWPCLAIEIVMRELIVELP